MNNWNMRPRIVSRELCLGEYYLLWGKVVRFIKVTRKGFNFLNNKTGRCICKHHIYLKGYGHKEVPNNVKNVTVLLTANMNGCLHKVGDFKIH